ncbi:MAG: bifunctional adenosylcobinamide kinase/adenosylcobinamide-phosphate guanylyltransferase [Treponema sp.]|jgi:adenosylcobinamide kinase/adenosylcobinamide-phosphate guanylyltransferase|nr:bifunctional adenosylcobinamide kinase/adenosylcobinamide-phosphate guanylyltransferase [Treponema sp.]
MKIFISGGCKNGKSNYAQHLAMAQKTANKLKKVPLYYIATMKPFDAEDDERILRHRREREGCGFTTIEQPFNIEMILDKCDHNGSFLVDSLTALLANEMFPQHDMPEDRFNERTADKIKDALLLITNNISNIVIISDYIYSDALLYDALTEKYRKSLAEIDRAAAANCDVVLEAAYTNMIVHKGKDMFGQFLFRSEDEKIP